MDRLKRLSDLVQRRNKLEREITDIIDRPAQIGHLGEYIASRVFDITLQESASNKGFDGFFAGGPLNESTVNIKWYAMREGLLDITPEALPDYYLVLTGPPSTVGVSIGNSRPWLIENAYLFDASTLVATLSKAGLKIGTATSIRNELWERAEIYPTPANHVLTLTSKQRESLRFFSVDT